jgi:hypothetical protein
MSDDTPTQRFDTPPSTPAPGVASTPGPEEQPKRNRGLLIALIAIGAVLLIAIIVVLILLLGGGGKPVASPTKSSSPTPTMTASDTPSSTPSVSPSPTATQTSAPPPSTAVAITRYTISPQKLDCSSGTPNLSITWRSVNSKWAYFGVNTANAKTGGMGWQLPPNGSDADFPDGYRPYQALCQNASTEYTITIEGIDGSLVSKQFVVTNPNP